MKRKPNIPPPQSDSTEETVTKTVRVPLDLMAQVEASRARNGGLDFSNWARVAFARAIRQEQIELQLEAARVAEAQARYGQIPPTPTPARPPPVPTLPRSA
jgi:post-segregation antitoxin (ccd killing protein)